VRFAEFCAEFRHERFGFFFRGANEKAEAETLICGLGGVY
jgi:hypothetical protein